MAEQRAAGIVLARSDYADADRILRVFTRELGLISCLAKGIKKPSSRKRGALELFSLAELRLHRRSGELFLATDAVLLRPLLDSAGDLSRLSLAFQFAEWIVRLAAEEKPQPEIFDLLVEFLELAGSAPKPELLELAAQLKLLAITGHEIEFPADSRLGKLARALAALPLPASQAIARDLELESKIATELAARFELVAERAARAPAATRDWLSGSRG